MIYVTSLTKDGPNNAMKDCCSNDRYSPEWPELPESPEFSALLIVSGMTFQRMLPRNASEFIPISYSFYI